MFGGRVMLVPPATVIPSLAESDCALAAGPSRLENAPPPRPNASTVAVFRFGVLPVAVQLPEHVVTWFAMSKATLVTVVPGVGVGGVTVATSFLPIPTAVIERFAKVTMPDAFVVGGVGGTPRRVPPPGFTPSAIDTLSPCLGLPQKSSTVTSTAGVITLLTCVSVGWTLNLVGGVVGWFGMTVKSLLVPVTPSVAVTLRSVSALKAVTPVQVATPFVTDGGLAYEAEQGEALPVPQPRAEGLKLPESVGVPV